MLKFIARLNIDHLQRRRTLGPAERQTVRRLLAEEEAKLAALLAKEKSKQINN
jgi:hypothetical protein